jgi:nitroimidazol reductase NimA-like FMN-containing flavoprotein (pyridoxamine 5'-phosphate oxidase superfamily)
MSSRGLNDGPAFARLGSAESWRLLATRSFGRVSFSLEDRVHVVQTSYVVRDGVIYFRAAAFGAVARQTESRPVTLQVDDMLGDHQAHWSVTFSGRAHRVDDAATLALLWSPVRPHAWESGVDGLWIALEPDDVRGQRLGSGQVPA